MKKQETSATDPQQKRARTPARKLTREELDTGILAAGCCNQGCCLGPAISN